MGKIDLKREFKRLYQPSAKEVALVEVPPMNFLMVDGAGHPETSADFHEAMGVLFGVSYTLKFMLKKAGATPDYTVMPPEGLWWAEGVSDFAAAMANKEAWRWTLMIAQPDFITKEHVAQAASELERMKNPPGLSKLRFESFHEGLCAQIMHIGPYAGERPAIEKIHAFMQEHGYRPRGRHHEIYLSDPRRAAPEKLKTVIRQPVE